MTDIKIRKGSGNYESADPKDTLRSNWNVVVRITRPLARRVRPEKRREDRPDHR